jgi:hypothetical protein
MAAETGLSHTTIWRIWAAFGLQPHRSTAKLEADIAAFIKAYNENPKHYKKGQIRRRNPGLCQTLLPKRP